MTKSLLFAFAIGLAGFATAQDSLSVRKDTTYWKTVGFFGLNGSKTELSDWQGGGQNNVAGNMILNMEANFKKDKHEWVNKLDAQLGYIQPGSEAFRKNIDQLFALSKYNLNAFSKYWYYAVQGDYRSQFAPGYNYVDGKKDGPAVSDMNSPGYIQLALGLDYKPTDYFSVTFAPIAGKITIVNRQYLADQGAYGVEKAVYDEQGQRQIAGKRMRTEFGGRLIMKFKKDIFKNVNLDSYLDIFSNYENHPENMDVVFNNMLTLKINRFFTANIISQMIYDDEIIRKRDYDKDGDFDDPKDINGPRLQMLSTVAIGFGYKF